MIKVAVVSAVYNVQDYLEECLNSLINQTLKDIEIILVNDGSTDNSFSIAQKFAKKDKRIVLINKPNSGYGDSMNVGIERAIADGAEYVAFIDPDDYIALDGYENLYNIATKNKVDVLRANITSVFYNEEGKLEYFENNSLRQFPEYYNKVLKIKNNKKIFTMNSNCGGLFSCEFIQKNKIKHNTTPGASFQDIGFWFQSYALAKRFYFSPNRYYYYRRERPGSSEAGKKDIDTIFKEYKFIENFVEKHKAVRENFYSELFVAMYRSVYWYFHLLQADYKKPFILKASQVFSDAVKQNKIDMATVKATSPYFELIINNPTKFLKEMEKEQTAKSPLVVPKWAYENFKK